MLYRLTVLMVLFGLACSVTGAAEVYRWVDDSGQVHFSDVPKEGAERIEIQNAQTFEAPQAPASKRPRLLEEEDADQEFEYRSLSIVSPTEEQVFWNTANQLDVSLRSRPSLRSGHKLLLYLDGSLVKEQTGSISSVRLTGVERGQHSLSAAIQSEDGNNLITSKSVSFVLQQTTINNPNNPNNPNRPVPSPR